MRQTYTNRLPGAITILIGLNILMFVYSGQYWTLINPKYSPVTAAAGCTCALFGIILVIRPTVLPRQTLLSAMLILGLLSALNMSLGLRPQGSSHASVSLSEKIDRQFSREKRLDQEYIKINIAELTTLIESDSPLIQAEQFLFRGQIYQSETGEPVVFRTAVACCLADAISVGVRIKTSTPIGDTEGQWVKIYGRVIEDTESPSTARRIDKIGSFMAIIQPGVVIQADAVEKIDPPEFNLMFQFRREEPFAY